EFSMTLASLPSMTATHELVVPRSIPITFAIVLLSAKQASRTRSRRSGESPYPHEIVRIDLHEPAARRCGVYKNRQFGVQGGFRIVLRFAASPTRPAPASGKAASPVPYRDHERPRSLFTSTARAATAPPAQLDPY